MRWRSLSEFTQRFKQRFDQFIDSMIDTLGNKGYYVARSDEEYPTQHVTPPLIESLLCSFAF
jgi:hypothetical protein